VPLSIIMVGQRVQRATSDARAEHGFEDTAEIPDRLDPKTAGGRANVMAAIEPVGRHAAGRPEAPVEGNRMTDRGG
jgi:hypothetical protein